MHRSVRAVVVLAAAAVLASCAPKEPKVLSGPVAKVAPARPVVAVVLMQQDQFFRLNEVGMRQAAEKLGVDLRVQNAAGAIDKEASIVETFTTQGVDAILVSPLSSEASIPALKRAHERGIKIVTYNNALGADFPVFSISSDQVSLGATSGKAAREWIEAHGGKARVAIVGFASQLPEQGGARAKGFKDAVTQLPGVEIVAEQDAWEAPQAANVVGAILAKNPDVVWAANEGGTVGAVTAVISAGKTGKVVVFGTDVSTQLVDFLLSDDDILQAVTAQAPVDMGSRAVEAAVKAIHGEAVEKNVVLPGALYPRGNPDELHALREQLEAASK